jgi:uncharacterized protein YciI
MKSTRVFLLIITLALAVSALVGLPLLKAAEQPVRLKQFIYVVRLAPRLHEEKAWTQQDREIAMRHFERLKAAADHGPVILAGRTEEAADKTFGIVIFEAADAAAARTFMDNDPAVKSGMMTSDLHPYMVAAQRSQQ